MFVQEEISIQIPIHDLRMNVAFAADGWRVAKARCNLFDRGLEIPLAAASPSNASNSAKAIAVIPRGGNETRFISVCFGSNPSDAHEMLKLSKDEWLRRKEERRAKQRAANYGRAADMHKLRLKRRRSPPQIAKRIRAKPASSHIGCSGWFYWKWRGAFYPEMLPPNEWFSYYAARFKTVEINASFYSWPTERTVRSWVRAAGRRRFVYTVKVCELITHVKRFNGTKTLVQDFSLIADLLGPRMGCFLFQLPPSYRYTEARLRSILSQLDHSRRNVIEFRHASWWNETVFAAFRETETIFCSCSAPRLPNLLVKTADDIYIRFHGTERWYRHDYTKEELQGWASRIKESGAKTSWIYFNNDYAAHATKNALELKRLLQ